MAAFSSWRRCLGCFPSWKSSSLTAAIKDRNSPTRWQKFFRISTLKSSGDPTPQSASRSYLNAGSSNAPSLGSIAAGGSPRIGRTSIARRLHSCASLQFASCSENSVIRPKLSGQTLSAYATHAGLTLAQVSVPEKTNEITAHPDLLGQLAETQQPKGALGSIDAMGCQVEIADKIVAHKADYLLPLKGNQPTLEADVEDYFGTAPAGELVSKTTVEKGHGRIETRTYMASSTVDWIASDRSYPGQPRFKNIKSIVKVHARAEYPDRCSFETRYYISSAPRDIERLARGARGHWGVESMHWLLDVEFNDDRSRYRTGHGAKNMAIVRRFALGLVRANKTKGSVKTRRKTASWSPDFLLQILQLR